MSESLEVKIARIEEQNKALREEMQLAKEGRKAQYETLENIGRTLIKLDNRIEGVEYSLAKAAPTIDEFVNIKLKVQGAGILGKWAWAAGASLITFLYTTREAIFAWMTK